MIGRHREYRLYRERPSAVRRIASVLFFFLGLFFSYLIVTSFLLRTIAAGSSSMEPTVVPGDRLFVTPLVYGPVVPFFNWKMPPVTLPRRGDLVLVRPPYYRSTWFLEAVSPVVSFFTLQKVRVLSRAGGIEQAELIRRVIGLPGDTVRVAAFAAEVRPAGSKRFIPEVDLSRRGYSTTFDPLPDAWNESLPFSDSPREFELDEGEYFLMSDNRSFTNDSRYWGPVGIEAITARVLLRYRPLSDFGVPQ